MNNTHTRKIRIGFIGYGIQARTSLLPQFCMFKDRIDIVALCDCDRVRRTAGVKHVDREFGRGTCRAVADFRDILRETFDLDHAKQQLYRPVGHIENFLDCIRTRKPTLVPAETGARAAILTQLCNLAYVYDTGFDWDPKKNAFANGTGNPAWLTRPTYRNGWTIQV